MVKKWFNLFNYKTKATAALIASVPEVLTIMPLEIAKIALQLDTQKIFKNNMFSAMNKVFKVILFYLIKFEKKKKKIFLLFYFCVILFY